MIFMAWLLGEIAAVMFEKARFDVESALTCKINLFLGFCPPQNELTTVCPTSRLLSTGTAKTLSPSFKPSRAGY